MMISHRPHLGPEADTTASKQRRPGASSPRITRALLCVGLLASSTDLAPRQGACCALHTRSHCNSIGDAEEQLQRAGWAGLRLRRNLSIGVD